MTSETSANPPTGAIVDAPFLPLPVSYGSGGTDALLVLDEPFDWAAAVAAEEVVELVIAVDVVCGTVDVLVTTEAGANEDVAEAAAFKLGSGTLPEPIASAVGVSCPLCQIQSVTILLQKS